MRALVQRVKWAKVVVTGETVSEIGPGLLTLLGVGQQDSEKQVDWLIQKVLKLRIFEDEFGKMDLSLLETQGQHLIVSQFTLYGDCVKGNRPSFGQAAPPEVAQRLYERALVLSRQAGVVTLGGQFQAHMEVSLMNDGPVTFMIES